MLADVTLIIPSKDSNFRLNGLLESISTWTIFPSEIIVIDSSEIEPKISPLFKSFLSNESINLQFIKGQNLYPGKARNIGILNSNFPLLAFLDTSTQPQKKWLEESILQIHQDKSDGVWGNTLYDANSYIPKIIRASTYGELPIRTLPGSIIKKEIFSKCGLFVESARAGEDGDWMTRVQLHQINMSKSSGYLKYYELNQATLTSIPKKWFRNYFFTSRLPFFRAHKDIYFYAISFFSILIAYNWNAVLAAWDMESIFYIPNITKLMIVAVIILYVLLRGIILPYSKGIRGNFLFPINFFFITIFSFSLDVAKVLAFLSAKILKNED